MATASRAATTLLREYEQRCDGHVLWSEHVAVLLPVIRRLAKRCGAITEVGTGVTLNVAAALLLGLAQSDAAPPKTYRGFGAVQPYDDVLKQIRAAAADRAVDFQWTASADVRLLDAIGPVDLLYVNPAARTYADLLWQLRRYHGDVRKWIIVQGTSTVWNDRDDPATGAGTTSSPTEGAAAAAGVKRRCGLIPAVEDFLAGVAGVWCLHERHLSADGLMVLRRGAASGPASIVGRADRPPASRAAPVIEQPSSGLNPLRRFFDDGTRHRYVDKWSHYFDVYHRHFAPLRDRALAGSRFLNVLEIGVSRGGSIQMWSDYFGGPDKVRVYAIDIDPAVKRFEKDAPNLRIFIGDQADRSFIASVVKTVPPLDVVIDDGGHTMAQQIVSLQGLYPHLVDDGVYLCEDTHTSYWPEGDYSGGLHRAGTFIEHAKTLVDQLNAYHSRDAVRPDEFTKTTDSITFYDSVVVIQRGVRPLRPTRMMSPIDLVERPEGARPHRLVSVHEGELCNRLKSLTSARRWDPSAAVRWPLGISNIDADIGELFEQTESVPTIPAGRSPFKSWRLRVWPEDAIPLGFNRVNRQTQMLADPVLQLRSEAGHERDTDLEFQAIPERFRRVYLPIVARLRPVPAIREAIEAFDMLHDLGAPGTVAVWIRTWVECPQRRYLCRVENFLAAMKREGSARKFFVASDSEAAIALAAKQFEPGRVVSYRPTLPKTTMNDVAVLFLLAKAPVLIASFMSTFSEFAWWVGGCKARVVVA